MSKKKTMHDSSIVLSSPDDGYLELANAIVIQAAEDYREYRKNYWFYEEGYEKRNMLAQMKQIEKFFRSSYGDALCRGKGNYIIDTLKAEALC